jgi:ribosomal protein S18 acetylase RimI-like enzyme
MGLEFVPVTAYGLEKTADVLSRAFSDYIVKMAPATPALLLQMVRSDSVDLATSQVISNNGVGVGAALIARRGWTCRLAGMALVPEARARGIGRATVLHVLDEAMARGERTMVLEVIEQNAPAVRLYETCGFKNVRRLVAFTRGAEVTDVMEVQRGLREIDVRTVAAAVTAHGLVDLPWQLSGETIAQLASPNVGYELDGAWIALSTPSDPQIVIRALVADPSARRRGADIALLRAVIAAHPGKEWRVSAIWPEELASIFSAAGFSRTSLSQWQMTRPVG